MSATILIVDDEEAIPLLIREFLADEKGFLIEQARSAEAGLGLMKSLAPDLCMVDISLPGMDGNTFIEKALAVRPSCKMIIHTGSLDYTIPPALKQLGIRADSVLFKPVLQLQQYADKFKELLELPG